MSEIKINLDQVLDILEISKNKLAVEGKLRPNLILEMTDGKTKAIKLETLATILDTLNHISILKGKGFVDISDILSYEPDIDYISIPTALFTDTISNAKESTSGQIKINKNTRLPDYLEGKKTT
ncbi:helix-turn-helix domain-containing protein [Paenibacillus odorifer]|uniref:helix-turn-helix domain-containing protein n=1 Tax=Paenibacillus odorifer TaxID=189426 RepID=UPI00096E704B|nr:helix-turn-helix transcriptional regulator [Paenibacillus odorifer]OMD69284.1 hypothetical protein BSK50_28830 [Paenibacillus odorifer]